MTLEEARAALAEVRPVMWALRGDLDIGKWVQGADFLLALEKIDRALDEPTADVTDDQVAAALDARAGMSEKHTYLYATEKCRCGENWTDSHWMRYILEAARDAS